MIYGASIVSLVAMIASLQVSLDPAFIFLQTVEYRASYCRPQLYPCPFFGYRGVTFSDGAESTDFIILAKIANSNPEKDDVSRGTTKLMIQSIVKEHSYLAGKKSFTVNHLLPDSPGLDNDFLVYAIVDPKPVGFQAAFGGIVNGVITDSMIIAYRTVVISNTKRVREYIKGAIAAREKEIAQRQKYFFEYLDDTDLEISTDAFKEIGDFVYSDVRKLAKEMPREKVFAWLRDPSTLPARFGPLGLFAGHCGTKDDAKLMRELLDDPKRCFSIGLDGLLAGYVLLDPKAGWEYLTALIKDPKRQDFGTQISIVRTIQFFWEYRQDVIGKDQIIKTILLVAENEAFADFAIEDLRKWKRFELAPDLLKLCSQKSHKKEPMVKRSLLKFMIAAAQAEKSSVAIQFVEEARKQNPDRVLEYEEILAAEQKEAAKAAGKK